MLKSKLLNNISKKYFSTKSHVNQIWERDSHFIDQVTKGNNISTNDFVNFTRVITQRQIKDKAIWSNFEKHLPNHINSLDEHGLRKVSSALEFNHESSDSTTINQLKLRAKEIRKHKGINEDEFQHYKPNNDKLWETIPSSIRMWMRYAIVRDWVVNKFSFGLLK